ncbi:flagellar motor/biogenesis protein FlaJ [Halobacterium hubeiense]|uniref:Flagellar motor/biogenesis protein FlaJ n=1 Tax=Halobacterium hubeiense TaxID=1407499 RepID=A0A0U5GZS1_9EURY|nr:archaellar assembly protein FlaJ [Halobacterium hubeiense]CQH54818.1 flagellar motor/biogenesis protein FlaJ [Halobacterium hubeiense]
MAAEDVEAEPTGTLEDIEFGDLVDSVVESYRQMSMPAYTYALVVIVPSVVFLLASIAAIFVVDLPMFVAVPIPMLGALGLVTAVLYPKIKRDQRRTRMENRFHLFVTHMTILSTTNIDRVEVFRRMGDEYEYGPLAEESRRIVQLIDAWNQSLDDACRMRANAVPSDLVADFLDRLAYTINSGESLEAYLTSEQDAIIRNYATVYEGQLENLQVMKDLYLSMVLSVTFALVFATVLPILSGTDPTMTVSAVVVLYSFIQIGFLYAIYTVAPSDPLWYFPENRTTWAEWRLRIATGFGVGLSVLLVGATLAVFLGWTRIDPHSVPLPMYAAVPTTPLIIPGLVARAEEKRVKDRDDAFTNFIRALGASETARQTTTTRVLETLRNKNFGALTELIDDLYKRLNLRLNAEKAWRYFTADAHSYLIQKFSEMYLIGRQMGGDPKHLGDLISGNMGEVQQLRQRRNQAASTMVGVLYGITAAATFAFFIGLGIVDVISGLGLDFSNSAVPVDDLINTAMYDIQLIEYLLVVTVLVNAVLSSLMIRVVDGGHKVNAYIHFVVLTWISSIIGSMTLRLVESLLSV